MKVFYTGTPICIQTFFQSENDKRLNYAFYDPIEIVREYRKYLPLEVLILVAS